MGAESSGFNMHSQEEWKYSAAENDTYFLNVDDDELNEMVDDQDIADEEYDEVEGGNRLLGFMFGIDDGAGDLRGEKTELLEKKLYIGDAEKKEWRYFLRYLDKKAGVEKNTKSRRSTQAIPKCSTDAKVEWRRKGNQLTMANRKEAVSMDNVFTASRETEEEHGARIRGLFSLLDSKNVGHIDSAQIQSSLSAMRIPADYEFAKALLHVCD